MESPSTPAISEPFDPAGIDVEKKNMPISTLIAMLKNDMIDLSPAFQRKSDLWSDEKQSRLIESILLKLPLPSMYFEYNSKTRKYTVIDGLQRLCALKHFAVDCDLRLKNLEFIDAQYGGLSYKDLNFQDQLAIGLEEIVVNVFKGNTPDSVKYLIFKRLNTGGTPLNNQEIRNAIFPGKANGFIRDLSEANSFSTLGFSKKRMKDREAVLRALGFMIKGPEVYSGRMDTFLNDTLRDMETLDEDELRSVREHFLAAVATNVRIFGDKAFRIPGKTNRKPSVSLFDVMVTSIAMLSDSETERLVRSKASFIEDFTQLMTSDARLRESVGSKSDRKAATTYRYDTIGSLIKKHASQ